MTGDGKEVHAELIDRAGDLTDALGSIGVKHDPGFPGYLGNLWNRLDCSYLIVGVHHGDKDSIGSDRTSHFVSIYSTEAVYRENSGLCPEFFQGNGRD